MSGCLRDRALLLLYYGGGISSQRTHLAECEACAARYRQLGRDLEAISQVLREKPPPKTVIHRFRPFTVRWLPTTAALALALVLVWLGVRMWSQSPSPPFKGTGSEEIWSRVEGLSTDLFSLNEASAEEPWIAVPNFYDPAAAMREEWPSEWYDLLARGGIESLIE